MAVGFYKVPEHLRGDLLLIKIAKVHIKHNTHIHTANELVRDTDLAKKNNWTKQVSKL